MHAELEIEAESQHYMEKERGKEGQSNLTPEQKGGVASLRRKMKNKEIVIFETDKSKRFSCDSMNNYKVLGAVHTTHDEVVTAEERKGFEKEINAHAEMWIRLLSAGTKTGNYDRIRSSMKSKNNPAAPLSILRKDHKTYDDETIGPPGRPVCGGDVSYNKRLSHLISVLLTDVYVGEETVCSSTEELLAEVEKLNREGIDAEDIIGSMDVEGLYPSLDIDFVVEKVCEVLFDSSVKYEGMNYKELGLYLSLVKTDEELQQMGLHTACPKRRHRRGPRPNITGCGTEEKEEKRHAPWIFPNLATIDNETKRRMMVEAVRVVLKVLMETHTYEFANVIRRQRKGGAIGMEITGVVAQIFMVWWDREFKRKLQELNIQLNLHERYVDDTNLVGRQTAVGARYDGEQILITNESVIEDEELQDDERTMKLLQSIANTIHPSIRMTIDYPSRYTDGKVPMLNVRMWIEEVEGRRLILYEHYEKEMATKMVIHAESAIPKSVKRTVLTQEVLRIMLHCSRNLPWDVVRGHINKFMLKMQLSRYEQTFRYEVSKSAINAFQTMMMNEERGIRPIHRPKEWQRTERMEQKEEKRKSWYKQGGFDSVLFVPSTPGGKLKRMYHHAIRNSGLRIKLVERTGRTLKSELQRSNPFRKDNCERNDCFVCTTTGKGNCEAESVTYALKCKGESCLRKMYKGETASNGYTRGVEHLGKLAARNIDQSPLWRHCVDEHRGEVQAFEMSITGVYRNDAMIRQITEAVQIENTDVNILMNDRAEWNMTPLPRTVISTS